MTTITLERMGSFFAGGRRHTVTDQPVRHIHIAPSLPDFPYDPNGTVDVESCYVQYFVPAQVVGLPILLIHGGSLSGVSWETTPDGRPGWQELLLRQRRAVYTADMMERGRAGWCAVPGVWEGESIMRPEQEAWWLFRFGMENGYDAREPFPGQRFPVEALDIMMKQCVPRWLSNEARASAAFREAVKRIGPCVVITHSSGSVYGFRLAFELPDLVRAVVSLEPSTFPSDEIPDDLAAKPFLTVMGDFLDSRPFWVDVDNRVRDYSQRLAAAGADAEYLRLADVGLAGHSHMFMMDRGNEAVLERLLGWLDRHLAGATS